MSWPYLTCKCPARNAFQQFLSECDLRYFKVSLGLCFITFQYLSHYGSHTLLKCKALWSRAEILRSWHYRDYSKTHRTVNPTVHSCLQISVRPSAHWMWGRADGQEKDSFQWHFIMKSANQSCICYTVTTLHFSHKLLWSSRLRSFRAWEAIIDMILRAEKCILCLPRAALQWEP